MKTGGSVQTMSNDLVNHKEDTNQLGGEGLVPEACHLERTRQWSSEQGLGLGQRKTSVRSFWVIGASGAK